MQQFLGPERVAMSLQALAVAKRAIEISMVRPRRCLWRSRVKLKEDAIDGPLTLAPQQGFHRNVAILDYFSLFNVVMQVWGISPEQWNPITRQFDRFPYTIYLIVYADLDLLLYLGFFHGI